MVIKNYSWNGHDIESNEDPEANIGFIDGIQNFIAEVSGDFILETTTLDLRIDPDGVIIQRFTTIDLANMAIGDEIIIDVFMNAVHDNAFGNGSVEVAIILINGVTGGFSKLMNAISVRGFPVDRTIHSIKKISSTQIEIEFSGTGFPPRSIVTRTISHVFLGFYIKCIDANRLGSSQGIIRINQLSIPVPPPVPPPAKGNTALIIGGSALVALLIATSKKNKK